MRIENHGLHGLEQPTIVGECPAVSGRGYIATTRRQQWINITMRIFVFCYIAVTDLRDQIVILNSEDSELKRTANLNEETGSSRLVC
jgi:hypothetical protein